MSYCSIGVPILLRKPIYSRVAALIKPVLYYTNRIPGGGVALLALYLCLTIPAHATHPDPTSIVVVQSEGGGPYQEFSTALRGVLSNSSNTITIIGADQPLQSADLVIAVGMKAATRVAASDARSVLNVLVPKAGYQKLLGDFPLRADARNYSAIYLDQPAARQAALLHAIFPDKRHIGVLYSTAPPELPQLRREINARGLSLHEQKVGPEQALHEALSSLLQVTDVLLALPDTTIYNSSTVRNILLTTYRSKVPLVGFSPGYVKAGALCALYSTPAQIAAQTAALIQRFNQSHTLPAAQYPQEFEVLLNEQVARSLGVHTQQAEALHDVIRSGERGKP